MTMVASEASSKPVVDVKVIVVSLLDNTSLRVVVGDVLLSAICPPSETNFALIAYSVPVS